ncbi:alpha-amylase [Prosthecochloris sp. ZM_2]|uniref:alpha-amylase family glycosyl hydrolase n=1 Tax=Prosthecochloris sp. ZM_2 TaxID=2045206 RepID=UPI000DF73256|nr:alpha-amylase family glycosyl hydrolase [Prosthecochloris sp. ZM_2]RNA65337.1 alpha-amylase [Prosthecochloris sp. ZM_2]
MTNDYRKEHFYLTREAREVCGLGDAGLLALAADRERAFRQAEEQTAAINRCLKKRFGEGVKLILPAQFHGMKLLHAAAHLVLGRLAVARRPELLTSAQALLGDLLGGAGMQAYLASFTSHFPPSEVFLGKKTREAYLADTVNRTMVLEESLFVWLQNQNPALDQFGYLLSDDGLKGEKAYQVVVQTIMGALKDVGPVGPEGEDPAELLTKPIRHSPNSILGQLRYIRLHWGELLEGEPIWEMLEESIGMIEDEDRFIFFEQIGRKGQQEHGGWMEKEVQAPSFADLENEPENYSVDSSWMPEVVMLAKSTFVWLDQLRKQYQKPIWRLQDIPDEELDRIASRGFTALWLIGLWERSPASEKIKRMQGNPEAKASAYALDRYEIANELGGYEGYLDLRHRALQRGLRLASDMVPNHTGLDSVLVKEHPEYFISSPEPPYPNYTYNGPNLSDDPRYGIWMEDGYWDRSDAAVTFKRVDFHNGDTRYIYHGNDGTSMPWNDTAQLNFLSGEVREMVIQQILHVARMFPVIRFDAAMVLVKKHIQRLWYPLPGHSAAVPSRSVNAISMEDFQKFIPEEFWREVVDRIHQEVPDTLLLAEAFWMLEGYFVRSLGMHRVYNSAFMHMLKKEDNASYRYLIKNTLEYDAEILKRYVNFMNNPDEDTAIAQFGKGDKYIGVCMLMITLPGLPMFGHGQVEGFSEKYGMEYARAYHDETPDLELVARHEREIFPILKMRRLFAEVKHFTFYDVYTPEGSVNENVFCYSNRYDDERALVAYNNAWDHTTGWVKTSVGFTTPEGIRQRSLVEGLGLAGERGSYVIFRDHVSGLEFIRPVAELQDNGMHLMLGGYGYNVFLGFREVRPTKLRPYDRLCTELGGAGVEDIETAALEMSLGPLHQRIMEFCREHSIDRILDAELELRERVLLVEETLQEMLEYASEEFEAVTDTTLEVPDGAAEDAAATFALAVELGARLQELDSADRLRTGLGLCAEHGDAMEVGEMAESASDNADALPESEVGLHKTAQCGEFSNIALVWVMLETLQQMTGEAGLLENGVIDDWLLAKPLRSVFATNRRIAEAPVDALPDLLAAMLDVRAPVADVRNPLLCLRELLTSDLDETSNPAYRFLGTEESYNKQWFRESRFTRLLAWLTTTTLLKSPQGPTSFALTPWIEAYEELQDEAFLTGYEIQEFVHHGGRA